MMFPRILPILLSIALVTSVRAELTWLTDFSSAKKKAVAESRPLLLEFTGSDWCFYCQKLDSEVIATPAFAQFAAHYVLVRLDYPQKKMLSTAEKAQNETLQANYKVEGFPTVVLCDAQGHELHRATGYDPGVGPKAYLIELFGTK
jgi:protein disulfide-isomerase